MDLDHAVDISWFSILCLLTNDKNHPLLGFQSWNAFQYLHFLFLTNLALAGWHAEGDLPKACCQIGAALWECFDWKWDWLSPPYCTEIYKQSERA